MDLGARPEAGVAHQFFDARHQVGHAVGVEEKHGDDGRDHVEIARPR